MRPAILLLLLILATVHCFHSNETYSYSEDLLEQISSERPHEQDFIYAQKQLPVQTVKRSTSKKPKETTFYLFMPWVYLGNNLLTAFYIQDNYRKEKYCFTFSLILIISQVHIGLLQMFASKTICYYLNLKIIYILTLAIGNTIAFTRIIFSRGLKWKQLFILFAYFSVMVVTGMFDHELYQYILENLLMFCPIIHLYDLKNKHKAIDYTSIPIKEFNCYNRTMIFLTEVILRRPELFLKPHTVEQINFFMNFIYFVIIFYICLMIVPKFRDVWILFSRGIKNNLKEMMGMKLEEEVCVICMQRLDPFAHLYRRIIEISNHYDSDVYQADCGHLFHRKCITTWGHIKSTCPIDSSPIIL